MSELQEKDLKYNWHPYTQHATAPKHLVITKGKGTLLWDENGKEYIDAIGSWWANPHGHCHPYIVDKITQQINQLEHVLFAGFTHPPAVELAEKLMKILPDNQAKLFYSDNGSTANEVAIKMALKYHHNKGHQNRTTLLALEDGFHGDTLGAMAASGISVFTQSFEGYLLKVIRIPLPTEDNIEEVKSQLQQHISKENPAAFIFEPLVQGAIGMRMYKAKHLDQLIAICKQHEVLTIADEVMTGFGRTGKPFASNYLKNPPDLMSMSKALTGGFIPMAVTSCTQKIYDAFYSKDNSKTFFHGHTFTANPAGCAAAIGSIDLINQAETKTKISTINQRHLAFKSITENHPKVASIDCLGVILRVEIKVNGSPEFYGDLRDKLYEFFIEEGVILRPAGHIIYMLPPYCITPSELDRVYEVITQALDTIA